MDAVATLVERLVKDGNAQGLAALPLEEATSILKGKTGAQLALFLLSRKRPTANHHECLRWLLERGVDPNLRAPTSSADMSLTAFAVTWSSLEQAQLLLRAGGTPDAQCVSALQRSDHPAELLEALLDAGLDPNFRCDNTTLLGLAVTFRRGGEMIDLLLARGADPALEVELENGHRWSAWHAAANNSHRSLALLMEKVPLDRRHALDPSEDTPLHFIMAEGCAYGIEGAVMRGLLNDPWLATMATARGKVNMTPGMMGLLHLEGAEALAILQSSPLARGIPALQPADDFESYWARATGGGALPGPAKAQMIWSFLTAAKLDANVGSGTAGAKLRI